LELINLTPYAAERSVTLDTTGRESLLVLIKATYALSTGVPVLAARQEPLRLADEYHGAPERTSVRWAAETALFKPAAEVLITGSAYTQARSRREALVSVRVGSVHKQVRVLGNRKWQARSRSSLSTSEPFEDMPLQYERAFGGADSQQSWPENPVGTGFRAKGSQVSLADCAAPNLEHPDCPSDSDRARTCGLGPIAPSWAPRSGYAGTYDARWQEQRMPLLPDDFDPRFALTAPADQVLPGYLRGGEPVQLTAVRPGGGDYVFSLPVLAPQVVVMLSGERLTPEVRCDTLHIDTRAQLLWLSCRAALNVHERLPELQWIKIEGGHGER
jgi:hypothetical protein